MKIVNEIPIRTVFRWSWALILLSCLVPPAFAQSFLAPLSAPIRGDAVLVTMKGKEIRGRIVGNVWFKLRGLDKFKFEERSGTRHEMEAKDVSKLTIDLTESDRMQLAEKGGTTVSFKTFFKALISEPWEARKLKLSGFKDVVKRDHTFYERVELPKHEGEYRLAQLLNPGFDTRIKVFFGGWETGATSTRYSKDEDATVYTTPGRVASYLVVKDGAKTIIVTKGPYKKEHFDHLFSDCKEMDRYDKGERLYQYFAEHVYVYDQLCGGGAGSVD